MSDSILDLCRSKTWQIEVVHKNAMGIESVSIGGGLCVHPDGLIVSVEHIMPQNSTITGIFARRWNEDLFRDKCSHVCSEEAYDLGLFWVEPDGGEKFDWADLEVEIKCGGFSVGESVLGFLHRSGVPFSYFQGTVAYPVPARVHSNVGTHTIADEDEVEAKKNFNIALSSKVDCRTAGGVLRRRPEKLKEGESSDQYDGLELTTYWSHLPLVQITGFGGWSGLAGESGCPIFNEKGTLVGLIAFTIGGSEYVIPTAVLRDFVRNHVSLANPAPEASHHPATHNPSFSPPDHHVPVGAREKQNKRDPLSKDASAICSKRKSSRSRYGRGKPSKQYAPWFKAGLIRAKLAISRSRKMKERNHSKWIVKKRKLLQRNELNLNPIAGIAPVPSKRKAMQATTTRLINRIWGEFYSNYSAGESKEVIASEVKDEEEVEEQDENVGEDAPEQDNIDPVSVKTEKLCTTARQTKPCYDSQEVEWDGEPIGKTASGEDLYGRATVHGNEVAIGGSVLVGDDGADVHPTICFVEYMFEKSKGRKMFHGRIMQRGSQTVLGNTANEREVFLTHECMDLELEDIQETVVVDIRLIPWGHQHRKASAEVDKADRAKVEDWVRKGLPTEYYCKSLYWPERGAFFKLPSETMGLGSGLCHSCQVKSCDQNKEFFKLNASKTSFIYQGVEYSIHDFVYVSPRQFSVERIGGGTFMGGINLGSRAYTICQLIEVTSKKGFEEADIDSTEVKIRRFFRPDDISAEKAYSSDIREIYYSEETHIIPLRMIEGKCEVRRKQDLPPVNLFPIFDHIFCCERLYDPSSGSLKQLPYHVGTRYSEVKLDVSTLSRKRKRKGKAMGVEGGTEIEQHETSQENCLATLDIFAGCGGLYEGLQQAGASLTKWAIEFEEPAAEAFKLNHPEAQVFVHNCSVILRAIMKKCGDDEDCVSTQEASELAAAMDENEINRLPLPGEVDFIIGGPPCQGFSGMNKFNQSTWREVQGEMILAFLSFADYYRPKYFLLENVGNFVSINPVQTFHLAVASLLAMGYQVRFGILEAGTYGVPQAGKRAFIWAASPDVILPEWPEPMHVFGVPQLRINLSKNLEYAAARSTADGAPFRSLTVRDAIGDLPAVVNGAYKASMGYQGDPVAWFQKIIRGNAMVLSDHISEEMNELDLIRCQRLPRRAGSDWRDLLDEKEKLSTGETVDLVPGRLPDTGNQMRGLFGRLDWEGKFRTSVTDPQGRVEICLHPEQDRMVTVRECARSQGFPDTYQFAGNILDKLRQIGNAVPPPLAYALGKKLKEAMAGNNKCTT